MICQTCNDTKNIMYFDDVSGAAFKSRCEDCKIKLDDCDKLLEFVKSIVDTDKFSSANHWYLHLEAKKLLEEIGILK